MSIATLISTYSRHATQKLASALCVGGTTLQISGMAVQKTGRIFERDSTHKTLGKVIEMAGRIMQSFTTYLIVGPFTASAFEGVIFSIIVLHPLILNGIQKYSNNSDTIDFVRNLDRMLNTATKIFNFTIIVVLAAIAVPSLELGIAIGAAGFLGWHLKEKVTKQPQSILGRFFKAL